MSGVRKTIAVLPGDGIGPEVTHAAVQILQDCAKSFEHKFEFRELAFGGAAIERFGTPLPAETLAGCRSADAILARRDRRSEVGRVCRSTSARKPACWACARRSACTLICGRFGCVLR